VTPTVKLVAEHLVSQRYRRPYRIARLRRQVSPYSSTFRIDELDLRMDDGRRIGLVLKDLSPDAVLATSRDVRPEFLYEARREIDTYRHVLRPARLGTAAFYGTVADDAQQRYWLFLEHVRGTELRLVGDLKTWEHAAAWLGRFHRHFEDRTIRETAMRRARLARCDAAFFGIWIDRAVRNMARASGRRARERMRQAEKIAQAYDRVVNRLASMPATIIHGEFYACNVIVQERRGAPRICPVDWELTAVGPGLIDVAALSAGAWTDEQRGRLLRAYETARAGDRGRRTSQRELLESFDYCRLHLAVRMLGWSTDRAWKAPPHHEQDWLSEAVTLGKRLGLA
jgi:Ser/Thr protein kinase RdoA (MazF antagonist)